MAHFTKRVTIYKAVVSFQCIMLNKDYRTGTHLLLDKCITSAGLRCAKNVKRNCSHGHGHGPLTVEWLCPHCGAALHPTGGARDVTTSQFYKGFTSKWFIHTTRNKICRSCSHKNSVVDLFRWAESWPGTPKATLDYKIGAIEMRAKNVYVSSTRGNWLACHNFRVYQCIICSLNFIN